MPFMIKENSYPAAFTEISQCVEGKMVFLKVLSKKAYKAYMFVDIKSLIHKFA